MASPALKRHFIHKATFLEGTESRTASGAVTWTWAAIDNGSCGTVYGRFVQRSHDVASEQGFMMAMSHLWMCDGSEDVEEEYRVRNIRYRDGSSVQEAAGTWTVESLIPIRTRTLHHYELILERVE